MSSLKVCRDIMPQFYYTLACLFGLSSVVFLSCMIFVFSFFASHDLHHADFYIQDRSQTISVTFTTFKQITFGQAPIVSVYIHVTSCAINNTINLQGGETKEYINVLC